MPETPPRHESPHAGLLSWRGRMRYLPARLAFLENPRIVFWLACVFVFIAGAYLRFYRLDVPPFDFPSDRQRSNMITADRLLQGETLLGVSKAFMELRILPWLTAQSRGLGWELWTIARSWAWLFGVATLPLMAWAGGLAGRWGGRSPGQCRLLGFLALTLLAFNPYHIALSRLILTESLTLFLQAAALCAFLGVMIRPASWWRLLVFVLLFLAACLAKLPSLAWGPVFVAVYLLEARSSWRLKLGLAVGAVALAAVALGVAKINPLTVAESFRTQFAVTAEGAQLWRGSPLWNRVWFGRTLAMVTLPGAFLILIGVLRAPWLFTLAMAVFMAALYPLTNLNTYNFCHLILPGVMLTAFGIETIHHLVAERVDLELSPLPGDETLHRLMPVGPLPALAATALLILVLYFAIGPIGPQVQDRSEPRAVVLQAREIVPGLVPEGTLVRNNDGEGSISMALGQRYRGVVEGEVDLSDGNGYFYSHFRYNQPALDLLTNGWVRWASLPGEADGLLITRAPDRLTQAERNAAITLTIPRPEPEMPVFPREIKLPGELYSAESQVVSVRSGESLRLAIKWDNPGARRAVGIRLQSHRWYIELPVPIRQGGFSHFNQGILCVPEGESPEAAYTFEFPEYFPPADYDIQFNILDENNMPAYERQATLPFRLRVMTTAIVADPDGALKQRAPMAGVYPTEHNGAPRIWSKHRWFSDMELEGYSMIWDKRFILPCPAWPAGQYELILTGEATPRANLADPARCWPEVSIRLSSDREAVVQSVELDSRSTRKFRLPFTAEYGFDSVMIDVQVDNGNVKNYPLWMIDFIPGDYGEMEATLRSVELKRVE